MSEAMNTVIHEGTAPGSHHTEHGKRVHDEAELLVGQQRVDEDESDRGKQDQPRPPVKEADGDKQHSASQGAGHRRVKVPEKGGGLLGRRKSRTNDR